MRGGGGGLEGQRGKSSKTLFFVGNAHDKKILKVQILWGKKKTNKHKEFWRDTPWCASRLSRGHVPICPVICPVCPGDRFTHKSGPNVPGVPGTSRVCPWHASGASESDRQIPLCDFSLSVFFSPYFIFEKFCCHCAGSYLQRRDPARDLQESQEPGPKSSSAPRAGHVEGGRSDVKFWGELDLPEVSLGCFLRRPLCTSKQGVAGSWLGIVRWNLMAHA